MSTLALRSHRPRGITLAGLALLATGLLLLGVAGAYFGYTWWESRNLDDLIVAGADTNETLGGSSDAAPTGLGRPSPAWQPLYPASSMPARQWADPRGTLDLDQPDLAGFSPLSELGRPVIAGYIGRADRISIPQLGVEASVEELSVVVDGDSSSWETPKFTVGHIPVTPNPGSTGNGWYFGHLESPVQGEGNVFTRLPQVPELLRQGEDVHVVVESEGREYLYLVSGTDLVHQNDMALYDSDDARITLVTCFPRLQYDHRLLVSAALIGFRDVAEA